MELIAYADRAVELVNTADPATGRDLLTTGEQVRALLPASWTVSRRASGAALPQLREVRPRLRQVFEESAAGRPARAVRVLNKLMADFPVSLSIEYGDTSGWHLHLADEGPGHAYFFITGAAFGLAVTVAERGLDRLGVCCAAPCRQVYVDTSTNISRRYCSDRCATRANVAAYRARKREAADVGSEG